MEAKNNHINYIELYTNDLNRVKTFYSEAFDWTFTDYGETYTAFSNSGIEGGFEHRDSPIINGSLVILYHNNLELIKDKVVACGGKISTDIFSFPGGRRFHFIDPTGNELAVWSEK